MSLLWQAASQENNKLWNHFYKLIFSCHIYGVKTLSAKHIPPKITRYSKRVALCPRALAITHEHFLKPRSRLNLNFRFSSQCCLVIPRVSPNFSFPLCFLSLSLPSCAWKSTVSAPQYTTVIQAWVTFTWVPAACSLGLSQMASDRCR